MKYCKKPIGIEEQIQRLRNRGLTFKNEEDAIQLLHNISYYRLRAYTYPFQNNDKDANHKFQRDDITFEDIIDLYGFDKDLRILIFNALDTIEVSLRTNIASTYSLDRGSGFWFLDQSLYFDQKRYTELIASNSYSGELIKEIKRSKEDFITHYYNRYGDPDFPPAWMTLEVVSMGTLSKLFSALDKNNHASKTICQYFGLRKVDILKNWMHALSSIRNMCAHHSRIWNRRFTIGLKFPYHTGYPFLNRNEVSNIRDNKLFSYLSVILYLLQIIRPNSTFRSELLTLLDSRPYLASLKDMGFPKGWDNYTLWKQK